MRHWNRYTGDLVLPGGQRPEYFGPLSHLLPGMLTFLDGPVRPETPGMLFATTGAIVLCRESEANMLDAAGHFPQVVREETPRQRFWRLFQRAAGERGFEPARVTVPGSAYLEPGSHVGVPPFKVIELNGKRQLACHVGGVTIGENCYVGATSTIQTGIYGESTELGDEVFIDNRVHVGHGTRVGAKTSVTAGAVLGAWLEIGDDVWIGVGAVIREHVKIGDGAVIGMGSVVVKDVPAGMTVVGNPAKELKK
jgi:acetyltransferase-like isoleucine patch superfamily enzyme